MKCKHCGRDFTPRRDNQLYCCKTCSKNEWRKRRRRTLLHERYAQHFENIRLIDTIEAALERRD